MPVIPVVSRSLPQRSWTPRLHLSAPPSPHRPSAKPPAPPERVIILRHRRHHDLVWQSLPRLQLPSVPRLRETQSILTPAPPPPNTSRRRRPSWERCRGTCISPKKTKTKPYELTDTTAALVYLKQYIHENHFTVKSTFESLDVDDSGTLDSTEFRAAFEKLGITMSRMTWTGVFNVIDADASGAIEYTEFLAALRQVGRERRVSAFVRCKKVP